MSEFFTVEGERTEEYDSLNGPNQIQICFMYSKSHPANRRTATEIVPPLTHVTVKIGALIS